MNEDQMYAAEKWGDEAEGMPDLFRPSRLAPQGLDGVGHFNYYDHARSLSFQWDGLTYQHVTVSHGGYGEQAKWSFSIVEVWEAGPARVPFRQPLAFQEAAQSFKLLCDIWIDLMEASF